MTAPRIHHGEHAGRGATLEIAWRVRRGEHDDELVWLVTLESSGTRASAVARAAWRNGGAIGLSQVAARITRFGDNLWHLDAPGLLIATIRAGAGGIDLLYARTWLLPEDAGSPACAERPIMRAGPGALGALSEPDRVVCVTQRLGAAAAP